MITFGDDAYEAMIWVVAHLHDGYTVALLAEGQEPAPGSEVVVGVDVTFLGADGDGVQYQPLNALGEAEGDPRTRPWDQIHRIHVY